MRRLACLLCLSLLLTNCQNKAEKYCLVEQERNLIDDENCWVVHRYPQIRGLEDSMTSQGLNTYLKNGLQLNRYVADCLRSTDAQEGRRVIVGGFNLQSLHDSLLSVELVLNIQERPEDESFKVYYPVTVQFPEVFNPPIDFLLGEDIYAKIKPHIKAWTDADTNRMFNDLALEPSANYALPFCLSADSLILYPGSEGEFMSQQRLAISLKDL
jgi:hypothetical protein